MGYQSRKRGYLSPRERNQKTRQRAQVILWFIAIATVVWLIKERQDILAWLKTYTY